jgi:23S rRNA pseudouridine1911/1915/1917 synthase
MKLSDKDILYWDNHLLVVAKAAGILTQPNESDALSLETLAKQWVKERFQKKGAVFLHAAHRLDCPVSGIVLFARTSKALSRLNQSLREQLWQKEYIALCEKLFDSDGVLEHYLLRDEVGTKIVSNQNHAAKKCLLKYTVLKQIKNCTLLKIHLLTGRHHQIRAQLAAINAPIFGDTKYGSQNPSSHLFLHHASLSFPHPVTNNKIEIVAQLPDYWNTFS